MQWKIINVFSGLGNNFLFVHTAKTQVLWQPVNGPIGVVYAFAINSSGHIFAGADWNGVFRSLDNGSNWLPVNTGLDGHHYRRAINSLFVSPNGSIFVGTLAGVFRSDNGESWVQANTGLTDTTIHSLAINSSGYIFAGTEMGIFRSTDNGNNWKQVWSGEFPYVSSLALNLSDHIFAAVTNGFAARILRSLDNGENWAQTNLGTLAPSDVRCLAINRIAGSPVAGYIFAGTYEYGIIRSTNNGESWQRVGFELPTFSIRALAIDPRSQRLFAGTDGYGVFRFGGSGFLGTPVNTGLTGFQQSMQIASLAVNQNGSIFAGTYKGVFRGMQTTAVEETANRTPSSFMLEYNYPNPFNPITTINFGTPARTHATLTVYNSLGQTITVLVDRTVEAGYHTVKWDASATPSGTYLYELKTGSYRKVLKMALVK